MVRAQLRQAVLKLDAMDPNDLRDRVEEAIKDEIESEAWERCEVPGGRAGVVAVGPRQVGEVDPVSILDQDQKYGVRGRRGELAAHLRKKEGGH